MTLYPAPGFLLVEIIKNETTVDGIYRSEGASDSPVTAIVQKIGREKEEGNNPVLLPRFETSEESTRELIEGDKIYFIKNGDRPIPSTGEKKLSFLPFEHVLALVEEEEK